MVAVLPGAVLPGGFEIAARKTYGHVSDGMICSTSRARARRRPATASSSSTAPTPSPATTRSPCSVSTTTVIEFEINPDRAYALSLRGVAREAALAYDVAVHDPAHRDAPEPNDAGYPVRVDDPSGCPVFATRTVTGFDPQRADARRSSPAGSQPPGCGRSRWPSTSPTT